MERINGLKEYIRWPQYRKELGLPDEVVETYELLAQGEYNVNYLFTHPVSGAKLLLRVNCGSQMHLEHQIEYEYEALQMLETSRRTPKAIYVDGTMEQLDHGVLVMEYLPGRALDYHTEMELAAEILADIHSVEVKEGTHLIAPENPLKAILEECEEMVRTYMESELGEQEKKNLIREMLDAGWKKIEGNAVKSDYKCCINTELNSTNFLINGKGKQNYLIDWEKPLYGDPAQDLGHFLAPTTTFWKTDVVLDGVEIEDFVDLYIDKVQRRYDTSGLKERVSIFVPITCLRGITWCAMAWVQYQAPDKLIFNESTFHKLEQYLDMRFLKKIQKLILDK